MEWVCGGVGMSFHSAAVTYSVREDYLWYDYASVCHHVIMVRVNIPLSCYEECSVE